MERIKEKNLDSRGGGNDKRKKVFVMMSGGVDSSVAAYLLSKNKDYEVSGFFIKGYNVDGCQEKEAEDARRVAAYLGIPFYTMDLEKEYKKKVVDYMINGYKKGITPNPDVMCNKEIKFGLFLEKALKMGADLVVTGHYVRLKREFPISNFQFLNKSKIKNFKKKKSEIVYLKEAKDENKDQSYFLWTLTQKQLTHCLFPIGDYTKPEIREIARKAGISTAEKKDSQGICFLGQFDFREFLKQHLPIKYGKIMTSDGQIIGEHEGVWFYTIGQRRIGVNYGLRIANFGAKDRPAIYVAEKDIKKNILVVGVGDRDEVLFKKEVELSELNFADEKALFGRKKQIEIFVRIRYRQEAVKASLIKNKGVYALIFAKPQKFVASGQSAVFYDKKGVLLGGGVIN